MAETTAVALLFDDAELGGHLRVALSEGGARIVHEGTLGELSRDLLQRVGADVVVINLDDASMDIIDRLYDAIDGDHPRVVFNEAQSSRGLDGWDRARWARHLAAKVLASGDIDPPRPLVPEVEAPVASPLLDNVESSEGVDVVGVDAMVGEETALAEVTHEAEIAAESESLEAELEALLSGEPLPGGDLSDLDADHLADPQGEADGDALEIDEALDFEFDSALDEPLYDGNFLEASADAQPPAPGSAADDAFELGELELTEPDDGLESGPREAGAEASIESSFPVDTLTLVEALNESGGEDEMSLTDTSDAPIRSVEGKASTPAYQVPDGWSLVDDDTPAVEPASAKPDPSEFGIQKMTAADYLAPDVEQDDSEVAPFSLELVSLEEAMAPTAYQEPNEMMLDELGGALTRVVMIGATGASKASVKEFLAKLPAGMRATIVHTQHLGGRPVEELVEELARTSALSVRVAEHGAIARAGELLVVPPDKQLRLLREGKMELKDAQDMPASSPSIDSSFTAAANVFGSDVLAILFAGQANDAVAGCQAIHDRGGRIWVEDAPGEHFADMVSGVMAERLADFSGTPAELATRLIEEY